LSFLDDTFGLFLPPLQSLGGSETQALIQCLNVNAGTSWLSIKQEILAQQENQLAQCLDCRRDSTTLNP